MTFWETLTVGSIVLILALKIYSVYRKSKRHAQIPQAGIPTVPEVGRDIQEGSSEMLTGDSNTQSRLDWGEIFLIIIAIGFCAPFGLILLWKTDRLDTRTKKTILIGYAALVIIVLSVTFFSCWMERGHP